MDIIVLVFFNYFFYVLTYYIAVLPNVGLSWWDRYR